MKRISRRDFLKTTGATAVALSFPSILTGKAQAAEYAGINWKPSADEIKKWRQFEGETVYVLTENTPPSVGIRGAASDFTKLTGMKAEFTLEVMDPLKEKIFLDLRGGDPKFHVNYSQPRPIGCVICEYWTPINKFVDVKTGKSRMPDLPDVPDTPKGLHDAFMPLHPEQGCQYYDPELWYGLPYDTAMGMLFYRKDLVDKYGKKFEDQYAKPMKPDFNTTWDDLYDMADFINKNCDEVDSGLGFHMAQNWPINQDYTAFLMSWGVKKEGFSKIEHYEAGQRNPGPYLSDPQDYEKAVEVLEYMKKLQDVIHPDSKIWDWGGLGTAQATGKIAMQMNCGEFCPYVEDPNESVIAGKAGYAVAPKGPAGIHAYEVGASGLSIPAALPLKEQKKAWLFVLWATGPVGQWEAFTKYYGTPVRKTAYEEARKRGWLKEDATFRKAQHLWIQEIQMVDHLDGFCLGPKIPTYSQYLDIAGGELSKWIAGQTPTPKQCLDNMISRLNRLHKV
ncbi:MAG: extracellular solute-binding protein [Desulfobacterales bacterium]|nr:MAG: extracellular solute-binding protein [Desulfobacterales bacterium]